MTRRLAALLGALLICLIALLGAYLADRAEPYEELIDHGPAPEARSNPYLAAEHFLKQQGRPFRRADSLTALAELPAAGQTLLMLGGREHMTPAQAERTLNWAAEGGHLLFIAEALWDEKKGRSGDLLLDRLGVQQYESSALKPADGKTSPPPADADTPHGELTRLFLQNEEAPAYFSFDTDFHLYDAESRAHVWANSAGATHLLQLYHGDGLITVLSDPWIWQNGNIGQYDNAWLLWYLTQGMQVTLLHRAEREGLAALLLRHFPEALTALALLILLVLWQQGLRQGPLQRPRQPARRQLQEHLRGSAEFLLRHGGQRRLLQTLQEDIERRARRRHPGFERLPETERWQLLARLTGQPAETVDQAMRPLSSRRQPVALFIHQVAHLQTLRNAL